MVINTNLAAMTTQNGARLSNLKLNQGVERLSTGSKLNRGADDPSGITISSKEQAQIRGLSTASHNVQESIYIYDLRDALMEQQGQLLQRMRDIAVRGANDATLTDADRQRLQAEMDKLKDQIDQTAKSSLHVSGNNVHLLYAPGKLDVVWVLDHSSSMDPYANSLANNAQAMFDGFADKGFDLKMGVTSYGIAPAPGVPILQTVPPGAPPAGSPLNATAASPASGTMSSTVGQFQTDVQNIAALAATANGLGIEQGLDATLEALNLIPGLGQSLRPDAAKIFVLVTNEGSDDNGEEGPDLGVGIGGGNTPTAAQINMVVQALNAQGVSLDVAGNWNWQTLPLGAIVQNSANPDPVYSTFAAQTGGISTSLDLGGNWVNNIVNSLENNAGDWTTQFQVGPDNDISQRITATFMSVTSKTLGVSGASVTSGNNARQAITDIDEGITTLNTERELTAQNVKNLHHIANDLVAQHIGDSAFNSGIADADIADEATANVKAQLISKTAASAEVTANNNTDLASQMIKKGIDGAQRLGGFNAMFYA